MRKKLDEVAEVTKLAGFEFTKYVKYIDDGEIIAIRALNLKNGRLVLDDIKRISKDVSEELPRSQLHKYDIVISYTGTIGESAQIMDEGRFHLAPNVAKVTPNTDVINPRYLFQYVRSREFKQQMLNYSHGSTQPTIPMSVIRELMVPVFDIEVERKIASILDDIDRKIENNIAVNDNLFQQAQAIFDSFFPDITSGDKTVGDYITPKRGKNLLSKDAVPGEVPVVAGGLEPATYHNQSNTTAPVLTVSASGANAGFVNLWNIPVWSSDSSFIDSTMTKDVYFWYVLLKKRQQEIFDSQTGSAQPHIYPQHIAVMPLSDLNNKAVASYTAKVTPLFDMIGANKRENICLASVRDALLPKLMSGELDVSRLDI